jgi:hypothetical protein
MPVGTETNKSGHQGRKIVVTDTLAIRTIQSGDERNQVAVDERAFATYDNPRDALQHLEWSEIEFR